MLAASLLRAQDIPVQAIFFETPFFTSRRARQSAQSIDLPLKVVEITNRHLEMLKNPRHGYGGNMNPCIDCHALMLRIAGEMLKDEEADFVISGEVLGQRPMSQNKKALALVARESGLDRLLLRPLSAKQLSPSIPEERGWVQRELLMGFRGRSRKPQMALAAKMGITQYPSPAGGCLLTEQVFSRRLKDLLDAKDDVAENEIELLKLGRHFRLDSQTKLVVGRNQAENESILKLRGRRDLILNTTSVPGPTALLAGDNSRAFAEMAAAVTAAYSDAKPPEATEVHIDNQETGETLSVAVPEKGLFRQYMI